MKIILLSVLSVILSILFTQCTKEEPEPIISNQKSIVSFKFLKQHNDALSADINGTISGTKISIGIPGNIAERDLIATFEVSPKATLRLNGILQVSGETKNNFSDVASYEVEAEDKSKLNFTVEVIKDGYSPNTTANLKTSQYLQNKYFIWSDMANLMQITDGYWSDRFAARSFYDFDNDGDKDLITGDINFGEHGENVPIDIYYYKNNNGTYQRDETVFEGTIPQYVHPRQVILGDYDNNGWMDALIIGHGWDKVPFPGERQYLVLNTNGKFNSREIPLKKQSDGLYPFTHSGCSGDIDNDGDLDIIYTSHRGASVLVYENDGQANFTLNSSKFTAYSDKLYFTSSLHDLNNDGYLDLVIAGHDKDQHQNAAVMPTIFWGDYSGGFSSNRTTVLPIVDQYGVSAHINFIDYNKDGYTDILVSKTGDGTSGSLPFYVGRYLQLIQNNGGTSFEDVSTAIENNSSTTDPWVVWYLIHDTDGDGDLDITSDDKWYNVQWRNDNGTFKTY